MARPLDADGQGGANDGSVAVYFRHHNGLIPPDFPKGSDRKYFLDGFHKIYLVSSSLLLVAHRMLINLPPKTPQIVSRRVPRFLLLHNIQKCDLGFHFWW